MFQDPVFRKTVGRILKKMRGRNAARLDRRAVLFLVTIVLFFCVLVSHTVKGIKRRQVFCRRKLEELRNHPVIEILELWPRETTLVDIGANIGKISLTARFCLDKRHSVIAIEPVKNNYDKMVFASSRLEGKSVATKGEYRNGRLRVLRVALSNETGSQLMYIPKKREDNAALSEGASTGNVVRKSVREEEVAVRRGDEVVGGVKGDMVVKIDVQGSEMRVLRGLERVLKRKREIFVVAEWDVGLMELSGVGRGEVWEYMSGLGFKAYCGARFEANEKGVVVVGRAVGRATIYTGVGRGAECEGNDLVYWRGMRKERRWGAVGGGKRV